MPAITKLKTSKLYYVSDKAYQHLTMMAVRQGYKKLSTNRAWGMSEFLNDLAYQNFIDTRPYIIVDRHKQEIANNRAPTWTSYTTRRVRSLYIPLPAIERYMRLALKFGIIKDPPYIVGGPSKTKPVAVLGFVFEGIGLQWITPEHYPLKRTALE